MQIKLRAGRRFGEVSRELEKAKPGPNSYVSSGNTIPKQTILENVGVSRKQNAEFEKLAAIPKQEFDI